MLGDNGSPVLPKEKNLITAFFTSYRYSYTARRPQLTRKFDDLSKTYTKPSLTWPKPSPGRFHRRGRAWRLNSTKLDELEKHLGLSTDPSRGSVNKAYTRRR